MPSLLEMFFQWIYRLQIIAGPTCKFGQEREGTGLDFINFVQALSTWGPTVAEILSIIITVSFTEELIWLEL